MKCKRVLFSGHAVRRMFQRQIGVDSVKRVLQEGEVIAEWTDETGDPCELVLGFPGGRPLHVVIVLRTGGQACLVATVYEPEPELWAADFRRRKS